MNDPFSPAGRFAEKQRDAEQQRAAERAYARAVSEGREPPDWSVAGNLPFGLHIQEFGRALRSVPQPAEPEPVRDWSLGDRKIALSREQLAEKIRLGVEPEPVCPYVGSHGPKARCPVCAGWPRFDPEARSNADKTARLALSYGSGYPRLLRRNPPRALWPARLALVVAGVVLMAIEGALRSSLGPGFAVASLLVCAAVFLGGRAHG